MWLAMFCSLLRGDEEEEVDAEAEAEAGERDEVVRLLASDGMFYFLSFWPRFR